MAFERPIFTRQSYEVCNLFQPKKYVINLNFVEDKEKQTQYVSVFGIFFFAFCKFVSLISVLVMLCYISKNMDFEKYSVPLKQSR